MLRVRYMAHFPPGPVWMAECSLNGGVYWSASPDGPYEALMGVIHFTLKDMGVRKC